MNIRFKHLLTCGSTAFITLFFISCIFKNQKADTFFPEASDLIPVSFIYEINTDTLHENISAIEGTVYVDDVLYLDTSNLALPEGSAIFFAIDSVVGSQITLAYKLYGKEGYVAQQFDTVEVSSIIIDSVYKGKIPNQIPFIDLKYDQKFGVIDRAVRFTAEYRDDDLFVSFRMACSVDDVFEEVLISIENKRCMYTREGEYQAIVELSDAYHTVRDTVAVTIVTDVAAIPVSSSQGIPSDVSSTESSSALLQSSSALSQPSSNVFLLVSSSKTLSVGGSSPGVVSSNSLLSSGQGSSSSTIATPSSSGQLSSSSTIVIPSSSSELSSSSSIVISSSSSIQTSSSSTVSSASSSSALSSSSVVSSSSALPTSGQLTIGVGTINGGSVAPSGVFTVSLNPGEKRTIIATENTGFDFNGWAYNPTEISIVTGTVNSTTIEVELTAIEGTINAEFKQQNHTVTLLPDPNGKVWIDGSTSVSSIFLKTGEEKEIIAEPNSGYDFDYWKRLTPMISFEDSTNATTNISAAGSGIFSPIFKLEQRTLNLDIDSLFPSGSTCYNGTTITHPTGGSCSYGTGKLIIDGDDYTNISTYTYTFGTIIKVWVEAEFGNTLAAWGPDAGITNYMIGDTIVISDVTHNSGLGVAFDTLRVGEVAEESNSSNTYAWKRYKDQVWLTENLNVALGDTKCSDGGCNKDYGVFYKIDDAKTICGELTGSFQLPSEDDWFAFEEHVGVPVDSLHNGNYNRGTMGLRDSLTSNTDDWDTAVLPKGTNLWGFNVRPAGYTSGGSPFFYGQRARFWTQSLQPGSSSGNYYTRTFYKKGIGRSGVTPSEYLSVRCVMNY